VSRLIEYDSVKLKLRLNDDSLKEELFLYIQEVDTLVNNRVRNKLGSVDFNGDPIPLPLTVLTEPEIDEELKAIATDLVIGKFRLQNSEKPLIWDTAIKNLDNYLDRVFGYTRDISFRQIPTLILSPLVSTPGVTVTASGSQWRKNTILEFRFDDILVVTSPPIVVTNENGRFTNVTFQVPANAVVGQTSLVTVNTEDMVNIKQVNYTVLPFTKLFTIDGVLQ